MEIKPDLKTDIGGIELENPVMTASGTFGYAGDHGERTQAGSRSDEYH